MAKTQIRKDQTIFIQVPGESGERVLRPARVTAVEDGGVTARFLSDEGSVEVGSDVLVYYEHDREFMQQSAHIDVQLEMEGDASRLTFGFTLNGNPVSAETRECYRVSLVLSNHLADVGTSFRCKMTDVSATGFSVLSTEVLRIGQVVPATLYLGSEEFSGSVCVQSVKDLGRERRYGLHVVDGQQGGTISKGVQRISVEAQREQLKRLSGTG